MSNPIKGSLRFVEIDQNTASDLVIEHHYLHTTCPISWAWAIMNANGEHVGVLTIGKPNSWSVSASLVGEKRADLKDPTKRSKDVYELNRLWVADSVTEHCIESRFIGWCRRELAKKNPNIILVSYADGGYNHVGKVYQASGWIYTGLSSSFIDITLENFERNYRTIPQELRGGNAYACPTHGRFPSPYNKLGGSPLVRPCPDCGAESRRLNMRSWAILDYVVDDKGNRWKVIRVPRSRKHRYVWFTNPKDAALLKWERQDYPVVAAKQDESKNKNFSIGTSQS